MFIGKFGLQKVAKSWAARWFTSGSKRAYDLEKHNVFGGVLFCVHSKDVLKQKVSPFSPHHRSGGDLNSSRALCFVLTVNPESLCKDEALKIHPNLCCYLKIHPSCVVIRDDGWISVYFKKLKHLEGGTDAWNISTYLSENILSEFLCNFLVQKYVF